jgi:hypothetical protein
LKIAAASIASQTLLTILMAASYPAPSGDEILARVEAESSRRHVMLKEYSGSRQYSIHNSRFGKEAETEVLVHYRQGDGERHTVLKRSGSPKLNGVIDKVLASQAKASVPPDNQRHQITAANYRVRVIGTEFAAGRNCYVLELSPRMKSQYLIAGKAWVDSLSYAVVKVEGQFAASISMLVGTPSISEDFVEVNGFWLPSRVRTVSTSFLLGLTKLEIQFSNYQLDRDSTNTGAAAENTPRQSH